MKTIWKFELVVTDLQDVKMPEGAQILSVQGQEVSESTAQGSRHCIAPMMWALVDSDAPMGLRRIGIVGTGMPAPETGEYIGTAICGFLVWHVFDGGEVAQNQGNLT